MEVTKTWKDKQNMNLFSSFISHHSSLQFKKRFTLIELLVVIAIIAILAGMLLPALNSARRTAKKIACVSTQKQLGTCLNSYFQDSKEFFPPWYYIKHGVTNYDGLDNVISYWFELINFPIKRKSWASFNPNHGLICPAMSKPEGNWGTGTICYGLNLPNDSTIISSESGDCRIPKGGNIKITTEKHPSRRLAFACTWVGSAYQSYRTSGQWRLAMTDNIAFRHNRTSAPITYLDGHVQEEPINYLFGDTKYYPLLKTEDIPEKYEWKAKAFTYPADYSPYF